MTSKILNAVHQTAKDFYDAGIMPAKTMREFDKLCLSPTHKMTPDEIKKLRQNTHVSQSVFAAYLNTSSSTVKKWETGEKKPNGTALKLLNIVERKGLDVLV